MNELGSERDTCHACPIRCKHKAIIKEPYGLIFEHYHGHGPEYETLVSLGPFCGVDDLQAITCANELCTAYTVDTISCGVTIAWAMECFERGLLTEKDTGGLKLEFGNAEAMVRVVEMVCRREGFGDVLAEGSLRAAQRFGKGAEQYAMHVKGVEIPMHNPYFKPIVGLGYALCPTGADHMRNLPFVHNLAQPGPALDLYTPLGILDPSPREDFSSPERIRNYIYAIYGRTALDCAGICYFCADGYHPNQIAEMVKGATGWNTTVWELMKVGERVMNMMQAFNIREGFTREDDCLPERFHQPLVTGPLKGFRLDKKEFEKAKDIYYSMMGWNSSGKPTKGKLLELDIKWVMDRNAGNVQVNNAC